MTGNSKITLKNIFISPSELRLRAGWRILAHVLILMVSAFVVGIPLALALALTQNFLSSSMSLLLQMFGMTVAMTLSIWAARKYLDKRKLVGLGLQWNRSGLRDLLVGVGIAGMMMTLIFAIEWLFDLIAIERISWQSPDGTQVVGGLFIWFVIFVLVAWNEELYSRGYLLQNIAEGINLPVGIIVSSVIFSLTHLLNPSPSLMSVLGIVAAGVFFGLSYAWTQRLWLAMGLHLGWNFFEGPVFGFPVSGIETGNLVVHTSTGSELLTGGAFGPEAGLVLYPALALGTVLVYLYSNGNKFLSEG